MTKQKIEPRALSVEEQAAKEYAKGIGFPLNIDIECAFMAGVDWQREQHRDPDEDEMINMNYD